MVREDASESASLVFPFKESTGKEIVACDPASLDSFPVYCGFLSFLCSGTFLCFHWKEFAAVVFSMDTPLPDPFFRYILLWLGRVIS